MNRAIQDRLALMNPDVAVLTEARLGLLDHWPHKNLAGGGRYPGTPDDGSKVAIVAKRKLTIVDHGTDDKLVTRNFLAVDLETEGAPLRVIGIVVRFRQIAAFIGQLPAVLERTVVDDRTVLAGDFNLWIPGGPRSAQLLRVLENAGLAVRTGGTHGQLEGERPLIDHIAPSHTLEVADLDVWPRQDPGYENGTAEITDHASAALTVIA